MAVVLDALGSYVQELIKKLVKEEVQLLLGVHREIKKMDIRLKDLKCFLADAERRKVTDQRVQTWVRELRDAMYDGTDILDLCQLKAMEQGPRRDAGCFNPLLFCLRDPLHAHDIGSRIKKLNKRLEEIKKRSKEFGFINLTSYENCSRRAASSHHADRRETSGELDKSMLVGDKIEDDTRKLVEMLTAEEAQNREGNKLLIFAIVGVGGIGKTTLAKNIFNDNSIHQEFTKRLWLSVNKEFSDTELLRRAIIEVGGDHQSAGSTRGALERELKKSLNGQKTFLVMDDAWDALKTCLVNSLGHGSRVLVTTRHDMVARGLKAEEPYHHVAKLTPIDCWSLLTKQVVGNEKDETQVAMLKDVGEEIIEKYCDRLPLAVKVMGGLLRQKKIRRSDWQCVLNDSTWSACKMPEELNYALYLSYEDLSPSLKACFLHFALHPKSALFPDGDIVGMWICEGFVHGTSHNLEDVGLGYYDELIQRNLIEPDSRYVDQGVCYMHDVVRSFAEYVARDEALVVKTGEIDITSKLSSQKFIRLSLEINGSESDGLEWSSLQSVTSLRTLISVGNLKIRTGDSLLAFSNLRTLHVEGANFDGLVEYLHELKHLRYFAIRNTDTSKLPENIGKMKFLQYINLQGCENLVKLPSSIAMLPQLRSLDLMGTGIKNIPRGFGGLTNLRQLYGFPAHMDSDWCSLEELGPLSQLTNLEISGVENVSSSADAIKAKLSEKVHLNELLLYCTSRLGDELSEREQRHIEEVFDKLSPPPCLTILKISGYFGLKLPSYMTSTAAVALGSLRILMLDDLICCTELPNGLGQLPCLELVQILRAPAIKRVRHDFVCVDGSQLAFPHLRKLTFVGLIEWEEWEWEEEVQAMQMLEELVLQECKLRCIPPALAIQKKNMRELYISSVESLVCVQNLPYIITLHVIESHDLERIIGLPKLQNLIITRCPKMKVLKGVPALERVEIQDRRMLTLPGFVAHVRPRQLLLDCSLSLLTCIAAGKSGPEWNKFSHIQQVKAYANEEGSPRKWYVLFKKDPPRFETNISPSAIAQASSARIGLKVYACRRTCPILDEHLAGQQVNADKRLPLCGRFRWNAYDQLVLWLRGACLHCNEALHVACPSDQWIEAPVYPACTQIIRTK